MIRCKSWRYLYRIEKDDQVFIASQIDSLIIPENFETFGLFKNTLNNLFKLKHFMTDTSALLKQELCKKEIKKKLKNIARNTIYINNNNEFPYVFISPAKKKEKAVMLANKTMRANKMMLTYWSEKIYIYIYIRLMVKRILHGLRKQQ